MKFLQQIASGYIPFCTLSINAIIQRKSLSVAWTWYCCRTFIITAPLEFTLSTRQPFLCDLLQGHQHEYHYDPSVSRNRQQNKHCSVLRDRQQNKHCSVLRDQQQNKHCSQLKQDGYNK